MKTQTGIWIDGQKAVIISLNGGKEIIHEVKAVIDNPVHHLNEGDKGSFMGNSHINNEKKFQERSRHQVHVFLQDVLKNVKDSHELFIMGPAGMKTELQKQIIENHLLSPKFRAIETVDYITENQMVAHVKAFYLKE